MDSQAADDISCGDWQVLYRHVMRHGYFRVAVAAREKAIARAYTDAKSDDASVIALHTGFTAAIDQADFPFAKECLDHTAATRRLRGDEIRRMQSYYALNTGALQEPDGAMLPRGGKLDRRFQDYVRGRSAAIVGPAQAKEPAGAEIDAFDCVVRPNYSGDKEASTHADMGSRTDVSFFANGIVKLAQADQSGSRLKGLVDKLDWAFIKNPRMTLNADITGTGKILLAAKDTLMFHGTPTLGLVSLHTLLSYGIARVKVFNSNFYYSANPYAAYYQPELVKDLTSTKLPVLLGSMASHDYLSQVHFVRNLHRAGLVELSPDSLEVVNLSSRAYLEGLEHLFIFPRYAV